MLLLSNPTWESEASQERGEEKCLWGLGYHELVISGPQSPPKLSLHINTREMKANGMLGCINKVTTSRDEQVTIPPMPGILHSLSIPAMQKKDVGRLKGAQKRATMMTG